MQERGVSPVPDPSRPSPAQNRPPEPIAMPRSGKYRRRAPRPQPRASRAHALRCAPRPREKPMEKRHSRRKQRRRKATPDTGNGSAWPDGAGNTAERFDVAMMKARKATRWHPARQGHSTSARWQIVAEAAPTAELARSNPRAARAFMISPARRLGDKRLADANCPDFRMRNIDAT